MKNRSNPNSHFTKTAYSLGILAALLMIVNVVMSAQLTQDGLAIDSLSSQANLLQQEIRQVDQELLAKTSLNDLSAEAKARNYITPTSVITVYTAEPLAYNH